MGNKYTIRINTIEFDRDLEPDIVEIMEAIRQRHKIKGLVECLLRLACEQPNVINPVNKISGILEEYSGYSVSAPRGEYLKNLRDKVHEMEKRIEDMQSVLTELYTIVLTRESLGIESKLDLLDMNGDILKHELEGMRASLGIPIMERAEKEGTAEKRAKGLYNSVIRYMVNNPTMIMLLNQGSSGVVQNNSSVGAIAGSQKEFNSNNHDEIKAVQVKNEDRVREDNEDMEQNRGVKDTHVKDEGSVQVEQDRGVKDTQVNREDIVPVEQPNGIEMLFREEQNEDKKDEHKGNDEVKEDWEAEGSDVISGFNLSMLSKFVGDD